VTSPPELPRALGVVGAGTMGAGIAQLSCLAGIDTYLHDPFPEALERGGEHVHRGLLRGVERARWPEEVAAEAEARLVLASTLEELSPCELVIEAAPERLDLKRELFERLSEVCRPDTIFGTNTSSILVSSLASAAAQPENVVGMHFFNPPPAMRLLEVIAATQTGERALGMASAVGEAMGKRVIVASDGPGFLVNRCGRPFGAEALRLLQERVATHEQIDRVCRLGGGFRMGPFELADLVGIDVGFEVAKSFDAQSFGEPRWRPSPLQARMVASGRLGRKTGAGWYEYAEGEPHRPDDPPPPEAGGGEGVKIAIDGASELAAELRQRALASGFDAREPGDFGGEDEPGLVIDASVPSTISDLGVLDPDSDRRVPTALLCADTTLHARGEAGAVGFHLLPPLEHVKLVELTRLPSTPDESCVAFEQLFSKLGMHAEWVGDAPGLVLGRIVCQLVNEAAFAVGEGAGDPDDVDAGVTLGLNHPRGPVEWGRRIGLDHVLATVDGLFDELRDPRYRAAPLLRRAAAAGSDLAWQPVVGPS
jgi:3-hydroxybutyryl-CoA dehydrogenase